MIFFDMDGVLVDHIASACEWSGKSIQELVAPGQWEVHGIDWATLPMAFWACLPKTQDFWQIYKIDELRASKVETFLLTMVCSDECYEGKMLWVERHMPEMRGRVITTEHKHLLAAPGRILYDDRDENISAWARAGGIGRLVPRLWNAGHLALTK